MSNTDQRSKYERIFNLNVLSNMKKENISPELLILVFILVFTILPFYESKGQFHPLLPNVANCYEFELIQLDNDSLLNLLMKEEEYMKIDLILKEVGKRKSKLTVIALEEFILQKSKDRKFGNPKLINRANIEKLRLIANSEEELVSELDKLLTDPNTDQYFIIDIATELKKINSNESKKLLKKHINRNYILELNLFKIETEGMSNTEILYYCINSVEKKLSGTNNINFPYFLAEKSLIKYRLNKEDCLKIINKKIKSPTWRIKKNSKNYKIYFQFLNFIKYRFTNPDKPTNSKSNKQITELIKEIE